jgi:hypothetical protein
VLRWGPAVENGVSQAPTVLRSQPLAEDATRNVLAQVAPQGGETPHPCQEMPNLADLSGLRADLSLRTVTQSPLVCVRWMGHGI